MCIFDNILHRKRKTPMRPGPQNVTCSQLSNFCCFFSDHQMTKVCTYLLIIYFHIGIARVKCKSYCPNALTKCVVCLLFQIISKCDMFVWIPVVEMYIFRLKRHTTRWVGMTICDVHWDCQLSRTSCVFDPSPSVFLTCAQLIVRILMTACLFWYLHHLTE